MTLYDVLRRELERREVHLPEGVTKVDLELSGRPEGLNLANVGGEYFWDVVAVTKMQR